jgi:Histidine kinase-like ATPase domain
VTRREPRLRVAPPTWLRLVADPQLVRVARDHAAAVMAEAGVLNDEHVYDVRVTVSEIVTNAMRTAAEYAVTRGRPWAEYERPVALRVAPRPAWTHLFVVDPDPQEPDPAPRDFLDEFGGRGLKIVGATGIWWVFPGIYGKTFHAVVPRPGIDITAEEIEQLKLRVIV